MQSLLQFALMNAVLVAVLAVAAASIGRIFRRPALTHALWLIVLAKLITPPVIDWPVNLPAPPDPEEMSASALATDARETLALRDPISPTGTADSTANALAEDGDLGRSTFAALPGLDRVGEAIAGAAGSAVYWIREFWLRDSFWLSWTLCGLWAGGAAICFMREGWLAGRFHRRFRLAVPAPLDVQVQAARLARDMGLARCPQVVLISELMSPMLSGIGRRIRLVFPSGLLERLSPEARGTLLAHELAHFGRKDHLVRGLELLVRGLYWWHPVVWWARRSIEDAEEECCDAWVIERNPANPRVYAEALLAAIDFLAESRAPLPPIATGLGQVPFLRRRLTQIMQGRTPRVLPVPVRIGVLVAAVLLPVQPVIFLVSPAVQPVESSQAGRWTTSPTIVVSEPNVESVPAEPMASVELALAVPAVPVAPFPPAARGVPRADGQPIFPSEAAVALSPDGRFRLSRYGKNSVALHDSELDRTTHLAESRIVTVAFSPVARRFAAGCIDGTIEIRDSTTARVLMSLKGHTDAVQSLAFAPDGSFLVSGSRDGEVVVWHPDLRGRINSQRLKNNPVNSVAVSRDGRQLAIAAGSWMALATGQVLLRDPQTLSAQQGFAGDLAVGAVAFHEDGRSLVIGEWSGRVTMWNLRTRLPTGIGLVDKDVISAARFSPDAQALSRLEPDVVLPLPRFLADPLVDIFSGEVGALAPSGQGDGSD